MRSFSLAFATVLTLTSAQPVLADHGQNFHCDRIPFLTERAVSSIKELSHNKTMEVIVKEYALQWEANEISRTCEAKAEGRSADFSCMQGRRDWNAIQSMIPGELYKLDMTALRPHQLKLQEVRARERPHEMAYRHCETLGVIKR